MSSNTTTVKLQSDQTTSISALKSLVSDFVKEREWEKYHSPKNVAVSVVLEAAELLEHFQWAPPAPEEIDEKKREEIGEELSDVMAYLLSLANVLDIDVSQAMTRKMVKNRAKYPTSDCLGTWQKTER